jgi:hypothetical protein
MSYKFHDLAVVLGYLVASTPALDYGQFGYGYLYRFDALAVYGSRKDEGVFFGVVATDAMVHRFTL